MEVDHAAAPASVDHTTVLYLQVGWTDFHPATDDDGELMVNSIGVNKQP